MTALLKKKLIFMIETAFSLSISSSEESLIYFQTTTSIIILHYIQFKKFNYKVMYKKGKTNHVANVLSRNTQFHELILPRPTMASPDEIHTLKEIKN
jgi:hypothetical protein